MQLLIFGVGCTPKADEFGRSGINDMVISMPKASRGWEYDARSQFHL